MSKMVFLADFFEKILSGIPSECQTVWKCSVRPDLARNCLQKLSADNIRSGKELTVSFAS